MRKLSTFHAAFMIEILTKSLSIDSAELVQSQQLNDDQLSKPRYHISNLSASSSHWRAMLRHSHAEGFRKATQMKYDAIENRGI